MHSEYDLSNPFLSEQSSTGNSVGDKRILRAVENNTDLLEQLIGILQSGSVPLSSVPAENPEVSTSQLETIEALQKHIQVLEQQMHVLSDSNRELAAKVLYENDFQDSNANSWEDRKRQIQETLQDETFDIDQFLGIVELDGLETPDTAQDVLRWVDEMRQENLRLTRKVKGQEFANDQNEKQIEQFQLTIEKLEKKLSEAFANQRAVAAIELPQASSPAEQSVLDEDPVILRERERLSFLQQECEEKMREMYIQSSLERAKASRDQTELQHQNEKLEEKIRVLEMEVKKYETNRMR
ncbi:MAG: hypothetical protein AAF802_09660 [Planctomycetota bacterium]